MNTHPPDRKASAVGTLLLALSLVVPGAVHLAEAQDARFLLLATSRTGTMEEELNEAGASGYRFAATQGGETAFGGREAVVVMERDPDGGTYRYILLATQCAAALCASDPPAALTHLPLARWPYGAVHLYGHHHARGDPAPRRRDVGVDAIGFAPRRLDWLLEDLAADSSD